MKKRKLLKEIDNTEFLDIRAKYIPWHRIISKTGRNDICPLCNSGKKFKKCSCYNEIRPIYTISY